MGTTAIAARHKVLLVDDDQGFLEIYREIFLQLTGEPEVHVANNGARALAMLESEPFTVLVVDLHMPKIDGLQVLGIARRKYPQLRIVVLTGVQEEEFRLRAYGMGVDQFWQKPASESEMRLFIESMNALLLREDKGGFRGVQSKSLVDIIQLESLSKSSAVIKVSNGVLEGRIWLREGEIIDAETQELTGEDAVRRILGWRAGSFEMLPCDPSRERQILMSCQALLLEIAQAVDEAQDARNTSGAAENHAQVVSPLAELAQLPEVQFALSVTSEPASGTDSWGVESPQRVADWVQKSMRGFETLGDKLQAGRLQQICALGVSNHVAMANSSQGILMIGFRGALRAEEMRENMKGLLARWAS